MREETHRSVVYHPFPAECFCSAEKEGIEEYISRFRDDRR